MKFGENNDWRESPIRNKLYDELYFKIADELGGKTDAHLRHPSHNRSSHIATGEDALNKIKAVT